MTFPTPDPIYATTSELAEVSSVIKNLAQIFQATLERQNERLTYVNNVTNDLSRRLQVLETEHERRLGKPEREVSDITVDTLAHILRNERSGLKMRRWKGRSRLKMRSEVVTMRGKAVRRGVAAQAMGGWKGDSVQSHRMGRELMRVSGQRATEAP